MKLLLAFLTAASLHAGDYITVTAYCPCAKCCGQWASVPMAQRRTASGGRLTPGRTAAGSPDFPFGTKIIINGRIYIIEDRMHRKYHSNRVDILMSTHEEALRFGVRKVRK
jgi:3D (Asp-Asp-Asp) domain-containing protein